MVAAQYVCAMVTVHPCNCCHAIATHLLLIALYCKSVQVLWHGDTAILHPGSGISKHVHSVTMNTSAGLCQLGQMLIGVWMLSVRLSDCGDCLEGV